MIRYGQINKFYIYWSISILAVSKNNYIWKVFGEILATPLYKHVMWQWYAMCKNINVHESSRDIPARIKLVSYKGRVSIKIWFVMACLISLVLIFLPIIIAFVKPCPSFNKSNVLCIIGFFNKQMSLQDLFWLSKLRLSAKAY